MIDGTVMDITDVETLRDLNQLMRQMRRGHRFSLEPEPVAVTFGNIRLDEKTRTVTRCGNIVKLTPREFDLLVALARRRGAAVSKAILMRDVWHNLPRADSRTLDAHMFELRRKLEDDASKPKYLLTVRKYGYRLNI
jgi:DNA-binding response OmpR family regulator